MGAPRNYHPKCFHFKGTCGSSRWVYLLLLTLGSIFFSAHCTAHCLDHLCWIISTRRQDLIIPSILWNTFYVFNSFECMSSNLHLMLSSLTTLTTSPTQFIRNPLRTITRVPAHHSSFYFIIICNNLIYFWLKYLLPEFWLYACPLHINRFRAVCRYCNHKNSLA